MHRQAMGNIAIYGKLSGRVWQAAVAVVDLG
jgi:hypothetical protein